MKKPMKLEDRITAAVLRALPVWMDSGRLRRVIRRAILRQEAAERGSGHERRNSVLR